MLSIASSKVTMTTILSQRKAGPWKRDTEKAKGPDSILRPVPAAGNITYVSRSYVLVRTWKNYHATRLQMVEYLYNEAEVFSLPITNPILLAHSGEISFLYFSSSLVSS